MLSSPFYVLRGAFFLWAHRQLWKYAAAPLVITTLVMGVGYYVLYHVFSDLLSRFLGPGTEWYWQVVYYVLLVVAGALVLVMFFFLFTVVATTIAEPFNELISEKTEQLITGRFADTPFSVLQLLKESGRGLVHALRILSFYVGALLVSLLFLLVPGIGAVLFWLVTIFLSAYMLSYQYLSYPMTRRKFTFRQKQALIRSKLFSTMGFGLGSLAVASVPIINVLLVPAAVTGGTLLFLDLQAKGSDSTMRAEDQ
ncbi:MAG: EI24 domain-containing protein [Thermodesulfobacteriota bacterium]